MTLISDAPAKINLSLHVGPVKDNGRHDLTSLIVFADARAADRLEAKPAKSFSLAVDGPYAEGTGPAKDNLVLKAARALNEVLGGHAPPLAFRLTKLLPCAAGIGGGSADAGAALRMIVESFDGPEAGEAAPQIASKLGGDVLSCYISQTGIMRGEGEMFEPLETFPSLPAVLATPNAACPTGPVFEKFDKTNKANTIRAHPAPPFETKPSKLIRSIAKNMTNDLQPPAIQLVPEIASVLKALAKTKGSKLTRMSGSGATCFALYETEKAASAAAKILSQAHPDWWVQDTVLAAA